MGEALMVKLEEYFEHGEHMDIQEIITSIMGKIEHILKIEDQFGWNSVKEFTSVEHGIVKYCTKQDHFGLFDLLCRAVSF